MQVGVLNGVNLNMLGRRDPAHYGTLTLSQLETAMYHRAGELSIGVRCLQSNGEGEYVSLIHDACDWAGGLVVNPGAWTHYSYAVRDALEIFEGPVVEVHLSDVAAREPWRQVSVIADVVSKRIAGHGLDGYLEALEWLKGELE